MTAGVYVPKPTKPDPSPDSNEQEEDDYTEPVKLPLWFKQGLEQVTQAANQSRKRRDAKAKKLPLGYLIVSQMGDWLRAEVALLNQKKD